MQNAGGDLADTRNVPLGAASGTFTLTYEMWGIKDQIRVIHDGGTIFDYALMCEGLARYGFDFATAFMVSTFTAMNICKFGTKDQQDRLLPAFMTGLKRTPPSYLRELAG